MKFILALDTIIEVSKETKEKTRDNLYKLLQKQFNDRLSELSLLLNEHRNKTEFHQANKKIKEIHELCDSYIKNLQEFKKIDEIQEISDNIVKPLKKMEEENMIAEKYRLKIVDYNYIVEALQAKELESAVKAQKALKDDLGKFATEVLQSNLTNEIKNHFLNLIEDLTNKTKDLEQKIAGSMKSLVQGTAVNLNLKSEKMGSLQFTQLAPVEQVEYKIPLYAKVVLLGESSVGKTHLILSMTGLDYSVTQGSTIGMDKYYKLVKMPYKRYETQLCFWDLGGQWNFRAINSLFLNEASVIVLVFDVTRAETFQKLDYWYEQLKHCRLSDNVPLIVVANKIDVGGLAISPEIIQGALAKYGIDKSKFFVTSAKTKEQIRELLECIAGAVDWGKLIEKFDNELGIQVALELKNLAADTKIISRSDLINILKKSRPKSEELEINAILEHYASQDKIQFGLSSSFVVLDPEFIDKKIGKILEIASKNEGRIDITEIERVLGLNRENIHRFIEYLCAENICFKLSDTLYIFPNVIHKQELPIDEYLQAILNSGTIEKAIEFEGPADFLFIQVLVALNREFGAAKAISNTTGIWEYGQGKDKTAFITNYYSGDKKGVIRFKAGGGNGEMMIQGALYVLKSVFTAHRVIFQEMQ